MFCTYSVHSSLRVLDSIDHQTAALLDGGSFGTVQVALMVDSQDMQSLNDGKLNDRYERLSIELVSWNGESLVHAASGYVRQKIFADNDTELTRSGTDFFLLMMTDVLKPLEHWLEHLLTAAASFNGDTSDKKVSLVKSLTMTTAGLVKSVGLKHYLTVLGDARIVPAPYMTFRYVFSVFTASLLNLPKFQCINNYMKLSICRGYSPQYLQGFDSSRLAEEIEAYTCESLLINSEALVAAAPSIPPNLQPLYECAALTGPLVARGSVQVALNSWVLEIQPSLMTHRWDSGSESMVRLHEQQKHSAFEYAKVTNDVIMHVSF